MADVAAVFEALCECKAIRRGIERAAGRRLDECDIQRLSAITFLHDIGKANTGFQAKRWRDDDRPSGWRTAGHSAETRCAIGRQQLQRGGGSSIAAAAAGRDHQLGSHRNCWRSAAREHRPPWPSCS
jgi:HD domain